MECRGAIDDIIHDLIHAIIYRVNVPAETAHTPDMLTTRAVFHAPMFALNDDAEPNACEPSRMRSTQQGRNRTHTHQDAHTIIIICITI